MPDIYTLKPVWKQSGLTLLEIMITVVILSLGLLGLAGLQMTGLKNNRNAYYNGLAGQAVQDIAERLRVNAATLNAISGSTYKVIDAGAARCASNLENTFDNRVACVIATLPAGQAVISELSTNQKAWYIAIRWTDLELPENGQSWSSGNAAAVAACDTPTEASNAQVSCYFSVFRP